MNYREWNQCIADYFFRPENADREILFFITKNDIITLAQKHTGLTSNVDLWNDFINAIKYDCELVEPELQPYSMIQRPIELHSEWNKIDTPPYIAYLVMYIIPLTEAFENNFKATNFYGRVNNFFRTNGIINSDQQKINTQKFKKLDQLWTDLEVWTIIERNCELGIFELKKFGNQNWIYVGKPLSQCILSPNTIKNLPEFFFEVGLVPNTVYSKVEFISLLNKYGEKILQLKQSVLQLIAPNSINELGHSIVDIVMREYKNWTGENNRECDGGSFSRIKRNYTAVPLFLQFMVNEVDETVTFSFRMFSSNDYPIDLKLCHYDNIYELNGWSKTLGFRFQESLEVKDEFNKWIAKFPDRDVRIFINAGNFQLSTKYWLEVGMLSKTERMFLMCKNQLKDSIINWGRTFRNGNFTQVDFDGVPEGYSLFKIISPIESHPEIPILTLYSEKKINLVGGIKLNFRTYLDDYLPEVEILNAEGNENVQVHYKNSDLCISLDKVIGRNNRWLLPKNLFTGTDFYININNEELLSKRVAYKLITTCKSSLKVDEQKLPKRDAYGRITTDGHQQYWAGNNISEPDNKSMKVGSIYTSFFTPINEEYNSGISKATIENHNGNLFCGFLSIKSIMTTEEFYEAFESYYIKEYSEKIGTEHGSLIKVKRAALNFYDYLGILDYDYEKKRIVLAPPQLIYIPTVRGRSVLLIGARDLCLVNEMINKAPKFDLQVDISNQSNSNRKLLLPDAVTIKTFGQKTDGYGENKLKLFAEKLHIKFTDNYFPQAALQEFSKNISDYNNSLAQTDENDYGWVRKIFNPETLTFEKNEEQNFDKSLSLIEYKLNEYTYHYKLWRNNKCYEVDKNWGKFIVLQNLDRKVILYDDDNNKVAIPIETPLPKLLSKSIMLLSGIAPILKDIDGKKYRVYENISGVFSKNLFKLKLGQQPISKELK